MVVETRPRSAPAIAQPLWNESDDHSMLNAGVPSGPIEGRWEKHKFDMKLVNPANKRRYKVLVVGSGLADGSGGAAGEWRTCARSR